MSKYTYLKYLEIWYFFMSKFVAQSVIFRNIWFNGLKKNTWLHFITLNRFVYWRRKIEWLLTKKRIE
jgi:hypothetical protein